MQLKCSSKIVQKIAGIQLINAQVRSNELLRWNETTKACFVVVSCPSRLDSEYDNNVEHQEVLECPVNITSQAVQLRWHLSLPSGKK